MRQLGKVGLVRRLAVKARMRPSGIVEVEIATDRGAGVGDRVVGPEVDLLVFHRAPEPLDEDIVAPGALAVHADGDAVLPQHVGEVSAGELAAPRLRGGRLWSVLKISGRPWRARAS